MTPISTRLSTIARAPARAAWLGRRRYHEIHALQRRLVEERAAGRSADTVLLVEHEPVITLGRAANPAHVLMARLELERRGYDLVETERGGDVTYHGPGQLVAYPIVHLAPDRQNVRAWVRMLGEAMVLIAREHGISAGYIDELHKKLPSEHTSAEVSAAYCFIRTEDR